MSRTPWGTVLLVGLWLCGIAAGIWCLEAYKLRAGSSGTPPGDWPQDCTTLAEESRPRLILFAHPHCPCTTASMRELERIVASAPDASIQVSFVQPVGVPEGWERTPLWDAAAKIPGVLVSRDEGGVEATCFGAETSGHVVLYGATGELLFSGGITAARGHEGDSPGRSAILDLLAGRSPGVRQSPVFGCSLLDSPVPTVKDQPCPR